MRDSGGHLPRNREALPQHAHSMCDLQHAVQVFPGRIQGGEYHLPLSRQAASKFRRAALMYLPLLLGTGSAGTMQLRSSVCTRSRGGLCSVWSMKSWIPERRIARSRSHPSPRTGRRTSGFHGSPALDLEDAAPRSFSAVLPPTWSRCRHQFRPIAVCATEGFRLLAETPSTNRLRSPDLA